MPAELQFDRAYYAQCSACGWQSYLAGSLIDETAQHWANLHNKPGACPATRAVEQTGGAGAGAEVAGVQEAIPPASANNPDETKGATA